MREQIYDGLKEANISPGKPAFEKKRILLSNDILMTVDFVSFNRSCGFESSKLKVTSGLANDYHVLIKDIMLKCSFLQANTTNRIMANPIV